MSESLATTVPSNSKQKGKAKGKTKAKDKTTPSTTDTLTTTSGNNTAAAEGSQQAAAPVIESLPKNNYRADFFDALICVSRISGLYVSGLYTGVSEKKDPLQVLGDIGNNVKVCLCKVRRQDVTAYDRFSLEFLVGATNESDSFGVWYEPDIKHAEPGHVAVADNYKILVKFPNDESKYQLTLDDVNGCDENTAVH